MVGRRSSELWTLLLELLLRPRRGTGQYCLRSGIPALTMAMRWDHPSMLACPMVPGLPDACARRGLAVAVPGLR